MNFPLSIIFNIRFLLCLYLYPLFFLWGMLEIKAEVNASVTGGGFHSVLLKRDGSLWGTGGGGSGQLGYGWGIDTKVFTEAVSADVTAIARP